MNVDKGFQSTNADQGGAMIPRRIGRWQQFGIAVRDIRESQGKTQQTLADEAGVSRAWLARFETGSHRRAELEQVMRVLDALDLSLAIAGRERSPEDQALLDALPPRRVRRSVR